MIRRYISFSFFTTLAVFTLALSTSCTVEENASFVRGGAVTGTASKEKAKMEAGSETISWAEKRKADQEKRKVEQAKEAAEELKLEAARRKEDEVAARKLAVQKEIDDARLAAELRADALVQAKKNAEVATEKDARAAALSIRSKKRTELKLAKLEAKKKAEEARAAREAAEEIATLVSGTEKVRKGGFFSVFSTGEGAGKYKSEGHDVYVNHAILPALGPSNAKIEISLGEQRARIYRKDGGKKVLVIDTQISCGKSGHSTSTGTFQIKEMLVEKRSTLYGHWVNASGATVGSSGESSSRPSGGARFVGADMPYWMRINGGIGMHVGFVPGYPASHGCIRVPAAIQPLIYSKTGVGTWVTISH